MNSNYYLGERIPERMSEATILRHQAKRRRETDRFIAGPLPLPWFAIAASLPGTALAVGLAIWHVAGLHRRKSKLQVCASLLMRFGVQRVAGYRGLRALEAAGLITVERHRGRCPVVTICKAKAAR